MTILNHNDQYIKLQSTYIQDVINNPADYDSIEVKGNINCCVDNCTTLESEYIIPVTTTPKFLISLDDPTKLNTSVQKLNIQSLIGLNKLNVITAPIDLGYVEDNCPDDTCTLETYTGYFAPLFKTQIDAYFLTIGIVSDVSVSFDDNILVILDFPTDFIPYSIEAGDSIPYVEYFFGFETLTAKAFLGSDGIYISPSFFGGTEFISGVYRFWVKIIKEDGASFILEENCAFIDIDTKCKVAAFLHNIKSVSLTSSKVSTTAHLLHYALVNGSNCGCNCEELCIIYKELYSMVGNIDPTILNDCGC